MFPKIHSSAYGMFLSGITCATTSSSRSTSRGYNHRPNRVPLPQACRHNIRSRTLRDEAPSGQTVAPSPSTDQFTAEAFFALTAK